MDAIIIEDEFLAAIHAETVLENLGLQVVGTAEDSASALSLAQLSPQLALVDLNLRDGFTGPAVARKLSQAGIRVVFVTANAADLRNVEGVEGPVLEKPLEELMLADALHRVMLGTGS